MILSKFNAFALTKGEMKNVVGGDMYCSCTVTNNSASLTIEYYSSTSYCAEPGAGAAYYTYTKDGNSSSGGLSSSDAASYCGYGVDNPPNIYHFT